MTTNTYDITSFMSSFLSLFVDMLREIYNILSSIQFFGFSLLTYFIALFVLLATIPLVISIINTQSTLARGRSGILRDRVRSSVERRVDSLGIGDFGDIDEE